MQLETIRAKANAPPAILDDDALLTSAQIRALAGGVSAMAIWRWQRDPKVAFPAPDVVMNKRNYWYRRTFRRWSAARAEQKIAA